MAILSVSFPQNSISPGDRITADVTAVGDVGIASDLTASSFQVNVVGSASIDVGAGSGPGCFAISFQLDEEVVAETLFLVPTDGQELDLVPLTTPNQATPAITQDLLDRFVNGMTAEVLQAAWDTAGVGWFAQNTVSLSSTAVACIIAAAAPEVVIAIQACSSGATTQAIDFLITFTQAIIDLNGNLTKDEKKLLKTILDIGNVTVATGLASGQRDKLIAFFSGITTNIFQSDNSKIIARNTQGFVSKVLFLIDLRP